MAELRSREPSTLENVQDTIASYLGGDRAAYERARTITSGLDAGGTAAHVGAYFTPAAPAVAGYDLYNIGRSISEPVKSFLSKVTGGDSSPVTGKEETRDEFFAARRTKRQTLAESQDEAEQKVRASEAYNAALQRGQRTTAQRMIDSARTNAQKGWKADQDTIAKEEERIAADWEAELADRKTRRDEYYNKGFQERHPLLSSLITVGAPIASAYFAKKGFGKIAAEGEAILQKIAASRSSKDLGAESKHLLELQAWRDGLPKEYAGVFAKTAAIPLEARLSTDVYDWKALPDDSGASQRAKARLKETFTTGEGALTNLAPSVISGVAGAATGSLLAKKAPTKAASAEAGYLSGITRGSPDEMAIPLGDRRRALIERQSAPREAPATPATDRGPEPSTQPPAIASPTSTGSASTTQSSGRIGMSDETLPSSTGSKRPGVPPIAGGGSSQRKPSTPSEARPSGYTSDVRSVAQGEFSRALDDVSTREMPLYSVEAPAMTERVSKAVTDAGYNYAPKALAPRVAKSAEAFEAIRKSGGDPFASEVRQLYFNRPGTLAVAGAVGAGSVAGAPDAHAMTDTEFNTWLESEAAKAGLSVSEYRSILEAAAAQRQQPQSYLRALP